MANNLVSTLIDELGQAIRQIDGTGDYSKDLSDETKMFYQADRGDYERAPDTAFPKVLIRVTDLSAPTMSYNYNEVNAQVRIILQFKQNGKYDSNLVSEQELLDACKDIRDGIHLWQTGIKAGTYTANWEIVNEVNQEIGRNDRLITIETIFNVELEENY